MHIQNIRYNPYLRTKTIGVNKEQNAYLNSSAPIGDEYCFSNTKCKSDILNEFNKTKEQQGIIGKAWDGIKNIFGSKNGSKAVENTIKEFQQGKISEEETKQAIENYKEGQNTCVDVVADMASGILAVGAFALAVPTGGASLGIGLGLATAVGASVKVGIKAGDALTNDKEYSTKDLLYDTATGGINGLLAPVTNGLGNCVTKTLGKKLGLKIVQEGAEEIAEQAVKQGIKQAAKSAILTQSVDVVGGTVTKRAIALGAGMAIDGALGGASDNMVRAALNGENVIEAGVQGAVSGLVMSPIIGGGFNVAGKAGRALNNKFTMSKILPEGLNTKFKQGTIGDCALLSTIDGMMNNPQTAKNIKKSITKTLGGDYNVKIGDKIVKVTKSSLSDEMLSDTTGIKIFEQAYKQLTGNIDGGFAEVVAKQFGLNPIHITNETITDELLDKLAIQQGDTVLSFGTLVDTTGTISDSGQRHYFTIKNIDADSKMITLTSPIDTSKPITLSYDEVKSMGISIDGGSTKQIDLPNSTRNNSDIAFKGIERTRSDNETKKIIELLRDIDSLKDLDEPHIIELINDLDKGEIGAYQLVSPEEYQRIKNKALISSFKTQTIEVGGREIYLTPKQLELYQKKMGEKLTPQNITKGYCGQVIMSDAMFIEATAINLGLDISGKSTDEIFEEIGLMFIEGEDIFPGITIQNKNEIADKFYGRRFKHTDTIKSVGGMGGDKAVHEINKALMGLFESDPTFQKNWIEYCATSPKFKQLAAIADTYKLQLREILGKQMSSKKAEALISQQIENEDHIIFRALQRDAIIDTNELQIVDWGNIECKSFIEILARKLLNHDTSEDFIGGVLTRYGNKFDTITYKFPNWNWETDGIYIPQYAS